MNSINYNMEILNIGTSPYGEDCVNVGSNQYAARARKECWVFKNQLVRVHGEPPTGCTLVVKSFPHDFGTYYELCARYDSEDEIATDYAYKLEGEVPEYWDEKAKKELTAGSEVIKIKDKVPVVGVPMTLDSIVDVECPYCGGSRAVEPDANYLVNCDCGKKYQLRSEI